MKNFFVSERDGKVYVGRIIMSTIIFFFVLLPVLFGSWSIVNAGERGVRVRFGAAISTVGEGFNLKVPYIDKIVKMDVKVQKDEVEASAASKDLQTVSSKLAVNFNLSPDYALSIYKSVGIDYKSRLIDPALQESVKAATSKYTAEELITKREVVRDEIKTTLSEKMIPYGIIIDQVNIINFDFSESFNKAIEAKVTAEQDALAAKNKLEQSKYEAEQRIAQAKGEAEAIKIQAQAISSQGGADYVALKSIEKWDGKLPGQMIPNATLPFINLTK
jgi:regulator of protease activity HflC (stomatin/prohibitin superfamily)